MSNLEDYKILEERNRTRLEVAVIQYLKLGWIPLGGVEYDTNHLGSYIQAMGLPQNAS